MNDSGDRSAPAAFDVGRGARDRAGGRNAAEQHGTDVADPLCGQLGIGAVAAAGHAVRDGRAEQ